MLKSEALGEHRRELAARLVAVALRPHQHVRGQRREAAADRPDVQIVHLDDVRNGEHRFGDLVRRRLPRRDLQQHSGGLPQQDRARPEDQTRDGEARERIEPVPAGDEDQGAGDRRAGERCDVGRDVQESAADVQALPTRRR